MSEYYFLLGDGFLPAKADRIARRHGATLVNYREPGGEKRHWFACRNRGFPHDDQVAAAVADDLEAAGIEIGGGS